MTDLQIIPSSPDDYPASPSPRPPRSDRCKLIIDHCITYTIATLLGLPMVIFLAIPALMPPEIELSQASSLSSLNISTSLVSAQWNIALSLKNPSKLIPVKYTHMKLRLSFDGRLHLSGPSLIPTFTQGPGNVTTVRAEALSILAMISDLDVKGLVGALKGGMVTVDVVVKARRRLHLGLWWVAVFDLYASCMDVIFTAPTDSKGGGDWTILGGTLGCTPGIFTQLWGEDQVWFHWNRIEPSWTNRFEIRGALEEAGFVVLEDHLDGHDTRPSGMVSMISLVISDRNSSRSTMPQLSQPTQSKMESSRRVSSSDVVATSKLKWDSMRRIDSKASWILGRERTRSLIC